MARGPSLVTPGAGIAAMARGPSFVTPGAAIAAMARGPISVSPQSGRRVLPCMDRTFYVYILTNRPYGTLYVGVTGDIARRAWEHRSDVVPGFSRRHGLHRLVWYEQHATALEAIRREKLIKKWHRDWKVNLVQATNPAWDDLFESLAA